MKIAAIAGSISKGSNNKKLVRYMKDRYKDKLDIEILDLGDVPMYNEDNEMNPPQIIKDMRKKILESDGILISTPEYNHSIPGVLKNTLDWLSRVENVMVGKPGMVVGASTGMFGTVKAQMHLRQILNSVGIGVITLPGNEFFLGGVQDKMDEDGNITDELTIKFLDQSVDEFIKWVKLINKGEGN